jgi:hypothetical protein
LAREQVGPFLLLGVDKDADHEQIEANWAQRLIWARKNQTGVPLQDVNWAREVLNDPDRRVRADVTSLNLDTSERTLRGLEEGFGLTPAGSPAWEPWDLEKPLADFTPAADIPDAEALRRSITVPPTPREFPAVAALLEDFARQPLDPWNLEIPEDRQGPADE